MAKGSKFRSGERGARNLEKSLGITPRVEDQSARIEEVVDFALDWIAEVVEQKESRRRQTAEAFTVKWGSFDPYNRGLYHEAKTRSIASVMGLVAVLTREEMIHDTRMKPEDDRLAAGIELGRRAVERGQSARQCFREDDILALRKLTPIPEAETMWRDYTDLREGPTGDRPDWQNPEPLPVWPPRGFDFDTGR